MRNGNSVILSKSANPIEFLPYLWGMETVKTGTTKRTKRQSSYRTYEEWKHWYSRLGYWENYRVLTVPMRNGNRVNGKNRQTTAKVLTVPMRNGNKDLLMYLVIYLLSSYRTYEEWKLPWAYPKSLLLPGSYRTYEEWKPSLIWIKLNRFLRSYRTYEEWKQKTDWEILR